MIQYKTVNSTVFRRVERLRCDTVAVRKPVHGTERLRYGAEPPARGLPHVVLLIKFRGKVQNEIYTYMN